MTSNEPRVRASSRSAQSVAYRARIAELEAQVAFLNSGLSFAWRQGAAAQFDWFHTPNSGAISISVPESKNPYEPGENLFTDEDFALFTSEDFARWRADALAKAEADEKRNERHEASREARRIAAEIRVHVDRLQKVATPEWIRKLAHGAEQEPEEDKDGA